MNTRHLLSICLSLSLSPLVCEAWDYEGHRLVNELALASLPTNFPAFVKTPEASERIAFLAGEPDRWRNVPDLNHFNAPDHYIDIDEAPDYGLDETNLTHFRYDFTAQLAKGREMHPEKFKSIDPNSNKDHTRQLIGFLPWRITEDYDKLKSSFGYLKAFQNNGGTQAEIANAEADAIYIMGVMGHYVGDGSQPLHTTKHFNGWAGENPQGFTREKIHSKIDGYFRDLEPSAFEAMKKMIHPAIAPGDEPGATSKDMFTLVVNYIMDGNSKVVPLYQLEKDGKLFGTGETAAEGRAFLTKQIVAGGQMLGDIWYSAWESTPEDSYLATNLKKRAHPPL